MYAQTPGIWLSHYNIIDCVKKGDLFVCKSDLSQVKCTICHILTLQDTTIVFLPVHIVDWYSFTSGKVRKQF